MKTVEIARRYNFNYDRFDNFLIEQGAPYKKGITGMNLDDDAVEKYVQLYQDKLDKERAEREELKRQKEQAENEKQEALSNMLITSGFNFDGYRIIKYSGYLSGDAVISVDRGVEGILCDATDVAGSLSDSLVKIRRQAIQELKEQAYDLGCNAVIGVDYDYITLEPETKLSGTLNTTEYLPYVFCVTANGNAVIIEKEDDNK